MDAIELRKTAAKQGVPQAIVEKDYALSVALHEISGSELRKEIVFKGGTAIRKAYFPDARFSEDLDFTVLSSDKQHILKLVRALFEAREISGIKFIGLEEEKRVGLTVSAKFISLLQQPQRLRLDFSFRKNLAMPPVEHKIEGYDFSDLLLVLPLQEIFAEKIHAIMGRVAPRDLYDAWFLLGKGVKPIPSLISKKFAYYNETFNPEDLKGRLPSFEATWNRELRQFMKEVPDVKEAGKALLDAISKLTTE